MPAPRDIQLLARYNQWMNDKLYAAVADWDDVALHEHCGAFFGSVFGTLDHLLKADTIWMKRFAEHPADFSALAPVHALTHPYLLTGPVHEDFPSLRAARIAMDETILAFAGQLTAAHCDQPLTYLNRAGESFERPLGFVLLHFFNHQTHHRGQITTLLSQAGVDVGTTDLISLLQQ
jgi:uncharacterized damage-inducible protein DinB